MKIIKSDINIKVAQLDSNKIDELAEFQTLNPKDILKRITKGDLCFCAIHKDKIIGYWWISLKEGELPEHSLQFVIPKKHVYKYDSYTHPNFRRLKVNAQIATETYDSLYKKGYIKSYSVISPNNIPSLKAAEKKGFIKLGKLNTIHVLGYKYSWIDSPSEDNLKKIKAYFNIENSDSPIRRVRHNIKLMFEKYLPYYHE